MDLPTDDQTNNNLIKTKSKELLPQSVQHPSVLQKLNSQIHTSSLRQIYRSHQLCHHNAILQHNSIQISFNRFFDKDGCFSKGFQKLNEQIKLYRWKNIKRLDLDFTRCQTNLLERQNLKDLEKYIFSRFVSVEHLSMTFPDTSFGLMKGFLVFGNTIGHHFQKLKQLDICLQSSFAVDDGTIKIFVKGFRNSLFNLEKLRFGIYGSEYVTEKTTQRLMKLITTRLERLKNLELFLVRCEQITSSSLEVISKGIQKHPNRIESIRVDFTGCQEIANEDKVAFCESLKSVPQVSIW